MSDKIDPTTPQEYVVLKKLFLNGNYVSPVEDGNAPVTHSLTPRAAQFMVLNGSLMLKSDWETQKDSKAPAPVPALPAKTATTTDESKGRKAK